MAAADFLVAVILGGVLGLVGQAIRAVAGLKKMHDTSTMPGNPSAGQFNASELFVSLLIGFVAGVAAVLITQDLTKPMTIGLTAALGIMAAGYAGTDFIEAFMKKYLPGS
jgi:uncharacterized membrane protein YeaQ/YmgE (transglycosylase-associated protein family)